MPKKNCSTEKQEEEWVEDKETVQLTGWIAFEGAD